MKSYIKNILQEHTIDSDQERWPLYKKDVVQDVVNKVYPHIANNLGKSIYVDETPPVELWRDIYARYSGIEEMEGEHSSTSKAEYDDYDNTIYIYYPNMEHTEDIIRSLLHEYTHSLQDPDKRKGHREEGYENDPDEIAASEAELNWKDYLIYLPDNLNESLSHVDEINKVEWKMWEDLMTDDEYYEIVSNSENWPRDVVDHMENNLPMTLRKELALERQGGLSESHGEPEWFKSMTVSGGKTATPTLVKVEDLLKNDKTTNRIMSLSPQNDLDLINKRYGTNYKTDTVHDPDPGRVQRYSEFDGGTAAPSTMIDSEINFGVGRVKAAILRGDDYVRVWDIKTNQSLGFNQFYDARTLNEQTESNIFTPQLINFLKYLFELFQPRDYNQFDRAIRETLGTASGYDTSLLYLTLLYNVERKQMDNIPHLLNGIPLDKYEIPILYEYNMEYKGSYETYEENEECVEESAGHAYGYHSDEDCDCYQYEEHEVTKKDDDDNEYKEYVPCNEIDEDDIEEDCECEQWEDKEVTMYYYPMNYRSIISFNNIESNEIKDIYTYDDLYPLLGAEESGYIVTSADEEYDEQDRQTWDYFRDDEEGDMDYFDMDSEWSRDEVLDVIIRINERLTSTQLHEQKVWHSERGTIPNPGGSSDEQISLFPTGDWEFPVGWEDDDDYRTDVTTNVPEPVFKKIMEMWDKNGIDFSIFKLLGIPPDSVTKTFVFKRYVQNTTKPIPVSMTYDCNDLKELFDRHSRDYNLDYISEYLCGDDSFWDSEDWYNYEWDSYMTDSIDENNWKTISEIFGGVSQSDAEDILNRSSSSEEVDELIEKYEEEIDEIQNYIVWAHNDEHEYGVKNGMAKDIEDKIEDHFDGVGRLTKDDKGSSYYTIEGDLRDYVNDVWDNTEDVFEYHPDYLNQILEDFLMDFSSFTNAPDMLFKALMDEEYAFWDYCEGKKGECLQPDTKFFDGYWDANYDINHSLADRLHELTYEPQITSGPEGEIKPLHEAQESRETGEDLEAHLDADDGYVEPTGEFTLDEVRILNYLIKQFTEEELTTIATQDDTQYSMGLYNKWKDILKLYGEKTEDAEDFGRSTRFAKWIIDNRTGAGGEDFDDDTIDFGRVTNPIKAWPSMYGVTATEDGWEQVYKTGNINIVAYDKNDAEERASEAWWDYEPDMETTDWGDWDSGDFQIDDVYHSTILKENKSLRRMIETYTNHTLNLYGLITHRYHSQNIISKVELRENIKEYINSNSLNKDILYVNEEELVGYLLNRGIIVEDNVKNSLIIEEPQLNTEWWINLHKTEKKHILEHGIMPIDDDLPQEIPEFIKKFLVVARFDSTGTWGISPATFLLYMKPNGQVMYVKKSQSLTNVPEQFKVGKMVTFGDLLNFENNSRYDLTMKGNLRETYLSTGRIKKDRYHIPVTPQKQFYLKNLLKEMKNNSIDDLLRLAKDTKVGWQGGPGRLKVFEFLNHLRDSGLVNMMQATDFVWSGSRWMRKYIDLHRPESLEPIDEYEDSESTIHHKETIQYLLDNADDVRDVIISNVIAKAELQGDNSLEGANRLMRPAAIDMVKLWAGHFVK